MDKATFSIRPLETLDELHTCEEIQRRAWDTGDEEVVPAHMLLTIAKSGGLLLGAVGDAPPYPLVGFVLGLLAPREPPGPGNAPGDLLRHHSHMLGVHPDWWGHGIGYRLKLAQREAAMAQGLNLVTWTFDPLERRNATLNFAKLGVVCRTYLPNLYGELDDGLNEGLPSDRFQVDWWLHSPRVERRLAGERPQADDIIGAGLPRLNPLTPDQDDSTLQDERLLVEVPAEFQSLKQTDMALARAWRKTTGTIFQTAFAQGYTATEYLYRAGRSYYLLERT
jgi:predicted GNAT superfamily acetyltransferase